MFTAEQSEVLIKHILVWSIKTSDSIYFFILNQLKQK